MLTFLVKGEISAHIWQFLANYRTFESHELNFNARRPQSVANFWIVLNVFAESLSRMVELTNLDLAMVIIILKRFILEKIVFSMTRFWPFMNNYKRKLLNKIGSGTTINFIT